MICTGGGDDVNSVCPNLRMISSLDTFTLVPVSSKPVRHSRVVSRRAWARGKVAVAHCQRRSLRRSSAARCAVSASMYLLYSSSPSSSSCSSCSSEGVCVFVPSSVGSVGAFVCYCLSIPIGAFISFESRWGTLGTCGWMVIQASGSAKILMRGLHERFTINRLNRVFT